MLVLVLPDNFYFLLTLIGKNIWKMPKYASIHGKNKQKGSRSNRLSVLVITLYSYVKDRSLWVLSFDMINANCKTHLRSKRLFCNLWQWGTKAHVTIDYLVYWPLIWINLFTYSFGVTLVLHSSTADTSSR